MSHDHAWGSALVIFAIVLWAALTIAEHRRRTHAEDAHYDTLRDPGMGALNEPTPIFDQLCFDRWETEFHGRPVIDTDWSDPT